MADPVVTDPALTVTEFPSQTVEVQDDLRANDWEVVDHLYCDRLRLSTNAHNTAELVYEIGAAVLQPGTAAFADYQPLSLRGKFVRITVPDAANGDIVWVGYILDDEVKRDGVKAVAGINKLVGATQVFQCVGLEYFLDRRQIDSAVVHDDQNLGDFQTRIFRPLVFNGGPTNLLDPSTGKRENRHFVSETNNVCTFSGDQETAVLWDGYQIVKHLLTYHQMRNTADVPAPAEYVTDSSLYYLYQQYPTLRSEGQTIFELLNQLASPQRGLVWWCEFDDHLGLSDNQIIVRFNSAATANVSLPGGGELLANGDQITLDFDTELDVGQVRLRNLGPRIYHQAVARGARQTCTLTIGFGDETLAPDWTEEDEERYKNAAKKLPDDDDGEYDVLPDADKKKRNDAWRKSDLVYRVYAAYRIPTTWDGKSYDGSDAGGERDWAMGDLYDNGTIRGGLGFHLQGLKLLNTTRLKRGWDYEDADNPTQTSPDGSQPELMPPMAVLRVATDPDRWQQTEKMGESDFAAGEPVSDDIHTSYTLRMQTTVPGILLNAHGHQHAIALNHWSSAEPTSGEPEVDYETLRATVCCEADFFCEGKYPADDVLPDDTALEILHIDCGEFHRLDFLAKGTIVGIRGGELVRADEAAVLRDDRKYLADVARLAFEWYQTDRQQLSVTFRQVRNLFNLGQLVTTIGTGTTQETVNTVISSIAYDLIRGTMTIETADATLDVRVMVS